MPPLYSHLLASAQTSSQRRRSWSIGPFNTSCASWLTGPKDHIDHMWLLGFGSGLNYSEDAMAGRSTDATGIMSEIRKVCEEEPSLALVNAAASAHRRFKALGK